MYHLHSNEEKDEHLHSNEEKDEQIVIALFERCWSAFDIACGESSKQKFKTERQHRKVST